MTDAGAPLATGDLAADTGTFAQFWRGATDRLARLPPKPQRNAAEAQAAEMLLASAREARRLFLAAHAPALYRTLTRDLAAFVRVEALAYDAAGLVPGLVPTRAEVAREAALPQRDKDGCEVDQGLFVAAVLADPTSGAHLCHAMLLPTDAALARTPEFAATGTLDLGTAHVERRGKAAHVTMRNPRFLNAEDETTLDALEIAVDVATLDPASEIAVLRGGRVEHAKWRGRRVFNAGINLTHLYRGMIPFLWYLTRDLGLVNKLFRGVARRDADPDEVAGGTIEKPWLAAVDGFAIGGGCQLLLVMDRVIAASDAYMTLPARKEGIIPGAANLRLARFTGDRIARQAILSGRRLDCDSPEGRLICDEVVAPADMDRAVERACADFTDSGIVSAAGNRRALRVGVESLDLFRRYMAVYAREQAYCHFSPALIANLERHWNAASRKV
ncbi:MAG TPA: enoyl-CoA hydratase/isomerase family protein [Stellaceae bacterium]|nr:enoyl-CoA hydratase/isomerase family protein [Stellaceae bacterium]